MQKLPAFGRSAARPRIPREGVEKLLGVTWGKQSVLSAPSRERRPRSTVLGCAAGGQVSPPCPGDPQVAAAWYELV